MTRSNEYLMKQAREALQGKWGLAIGTNLIYFLLTGAFNGSAGFYPFPGLLSILISGPLALGNAIFSLSLSRKEDARTELLFKGFNHFGTALVAYILMLLYIVLWSLLLIVPGIIKAISYSQTFYIIAGDPTMEATKAMEKSEEMMNGYKWKYFYLCLNFFGWALLCILTLGIGFLWLFPYISVTMAAFYDDLKEHGNYNMNE